MLSQGTRQVLLRSRSKTAWEQAGAPMPDSLLWVPGSALTPVLCQLLQPGQEHTARTWSHGKHPMHAGAHPRDKPPFKHRYILSISLSPDKSFSWRNLPPSPASRSDPPTCPLQAGWALGSPLQAQTVGPRWDMQAEEPHTHERAGSACWSTLLPWLLASQESPGSQPSGWSMQLFQEAPREGEGAAIMSAPMFSSHPLGKREESSTAWAHLPGTVQQPGMGT